MPTLPTYDTTKVQTLTLSPDQVGVQTFGPNDWTTGPFPHTVSSIRYLGLVFDFGITNESSEGYALAPRRPFTSVTADLAGTGETDQYWTLVITTSSFSIPDTAVTIWLVNDPTPSDFSDTNLISTALDDPGEGFLIADAVPPTASNWVVVSAFQTFQLQLDFNATLTDAVDGSLVTHAIAKLVNDPKWNGKLQFAMRGGSPVKTIPATAASLSGPTNPWHTGGMGFPKDRRARVVHDYVGGFPYLSDEAVRDGYRDGIMVHPQSWDPDDPLDTERYVPSPKEGVVDDEIVDLE